MSNIQIQALPPAVPTHLLRLLSQAEPATIGHFHDQGFMHHRIVPVTPVPRTVGTAVTVFCAGQDGAILHHALGQLRPGDFLVVDRGGDDLIACIGGASALAAALRGAAGIVVDGRVTDAQELRAAGIPVWARGLSPRTTRSGPGRDGAFCTAIACGDIAVAPGQAILADENGILCLAPGEIEAVAGRAVALQEQEHTLLARLRAGDTYPALLKTVLHTD